LPYIDNNAGQVLVDDNPQFMDTEWLEQKAAVEKYIKPLFCHPNVEGHKELARQIINLIDNHAQTSQ
jgi:hypothetical protein